MDTIKQHSKAIGIVAGAAAVVAGLYFIFKKTEKEEYGDHVEITDETASKLSQAQKTGILTAIKVEYQGGYLTMPTISQICDATLKFAAPQFIELTRRDREERRAYKNNLKKYIDLWDDYARSLEEVIESSQREVLQGLNVSEAQWEESNSFYMSQGNQELMMLHATLPQKLKMNLGGSKMMSKEEFKSILRTQVDLLDKEIENAGTISSMIKRPEEIAPIIQNRVNDQIYEQFGIEEEDTFASMKQYMMDPEVQQIFMDLQRVTMKLMPEIGPGY
jgi:hypothetical protein